MIYYNNVGDLKKIYIIFGGCIMVNEKNSDNYQELTEARKDYKLHLTILVCIVIAEYIGMLTVNLYGITIVFMPLLYSLVLAIASGQNIQIIFNAGPAILLQEIGNLGTIFAALPVALLLGFKRESIGMTSSICREPQMAVVIDTFGFNSPETKGFFTVFLIGTVLGTPFISLLASVLAHVIPLHPYAYGMACGIGSASMNAAAVASLCAIFPSATVQLEAFSGMANLLSMVTGMYVYILVAIPLTEWLYRKLEPVISRILFKKENKKIKD